MSADRRPLAALVAGALALSGCGGGDGAQAYADRVEEARVGLREAIANLQSRAAPTSTPAADDRALAAYERAARRAVERLRDADPPRAAQEAHRRLVAGVRDYAEAVAAARRALRDELSDPLEIRNRLRERAVTASRRIDAAVADVNRALEG
jgi:hypothetical protein